jgi:hypothetical protein
VRLPAQARTRPAGGGVSCLTVLLLECCAIVQPARFASRDVRAGRQGHARTVTTDRSVHCDSKDSGARISYGHPVAQADTDPGLTSHAVVSTLEQSPDGEGCALTAGRCPGCREWPPDFQ